MADMIFTTPIRLSEAAPSLPHTPLILQFAAVLSDLSGFIAAERDLEFYGSMNLACDAWIADAECARAKVLDSLSQLLATRVTQSEELPLRYCGIITRTIITCDNVNDFNKAASLPYRRPGLFHSRGKAALARYINLMIAQVQAHFSELVTLAEIAGPLDMEYAGAPPVEPRIMMVAAA